MKYRVERDALGEKKLPSDAYWGINAQRAIENFPISGLRMWPELTDAYVLVKKCAALANMELGVLKKRVGRAIVRACDEVLAGELRDQFVVDAFQAGAGTSQNMNTNEVIANRAAELLGGKRGDYKLVHPNDHVNFAQSTNDTFPTAMRISARLGTDDLLDAMGVLAKSFGRKARRFDRILKSGRTHLQDAVPIRLGQEFAAYAACVRKNMASVKEAAKHCEELGIGGSAAGTGLNAHPAYPRKFVAHLNKLTKKRFKVACDLREAMQSNFPIARLSSALRDFALDLIRIANDLRLLSSGPTTGLAEIVLPPVQAGSSIMPGKVNPVIAECTNMVCFQVVGNDHVIAMANQAGQMELNVMMPVMAFNILFSLRILANMCRTLAARCVDGIVADRERCRDYAYSSMGLATALAPHIGYLAAAEIAKEAYRTKRTIVEVAREKGVLPPDELEEILEPYSMTEPGIPGMAGGERARGKGRK